ncbi:MAG: ABC transporter substrate-binding protein [Deltaproteobacteria bacterium]|nr:ABC transporter substrate-binding protein [Deltaproteobacteria bacterium]
MSRTPPDELVVLMESFPASLDPLMVGDAYGVRISHQLIYETLVGLNDRLEISPGVAESWAKISPTRWRLTLRRDIHFSDGKALDSGDVVETLRRVMDPKVGSPYGAVLREKLASVKAAGPYGVELTLTQPYGSFLADLILPVLPRLPASGQIPPGSGPFQLAAMEPGRITLSRNPRYHGVPPTLERITFRVVKDDATRMLKLRKGDADLVMNALPLDKLVLFQRKPLNEWFQLLEAPGLSYQYLGFNMTHPVLKNPQVRLALAHALDVDTLIHYREKDHARRAWGMFPPESPYHSPTPPPAFDPALAERLLDQAGYPRREDGFRFEVTYKTTTNRHAVAQGRIIAGMWRKVGVLVTVRAYEWGTFYEDIQKGNFDLFSLRWLGVTDPDYLYELFHSSRWPVKGRNRVRYADAQMDRWLEEGRLTQSESARKAVYLKIQRKLAQDLPYVSLWFGHQTAVASRRLSGLRFHPTGGFQYLPWVKKSAMTP